MIKGDGKTNVALLLGVFLLGLTIAARAQDSATPQPTSTPPAPRSIRVSFLPPPLDGTISLGIYDAKGKLVRTLHREADINEFEIGQDALSTKWDGKDDAGENVPAGKYSARGFVVGDLGIKGVGFFFNDWISGENSPRITHIRSLSLRDDRLLLGVDLISPQTEGYVLYDVAGKTLKLSDADKSTPSPSETSAGRNGTRWVIDRTETGTTELRQLSSSGEFLRRLTVSADEPQPKSVAASMTEDKIYLLEENGTTQRVRGLSLIETKSAGGPEPVSEWKVDFEKSIVAHKDFSVVDGKPVASAPAGTEAPEKLKVKLQPNPLVNDARVTVELAIGVDADGTFLKTSDGLPLYSISETPGIGRALLIAQGANATDVFQDDGAVVEQFRVTGIDQMMGFDCGGFELK